MVLGHAVEPDLGAVRRDGQETLAGAVLDARQAAEVHLVVGHPVVRATRGGLRCRADRRQQFTRRHAGQVQLGALPEVDGVQAGVLQRAGRRTGIAAAVRAATGIYPGTGVHGTQARHIDIPVLHHPVGHTMAPILYPISAA